MIGSLLYKTKDNRKILVSSEALTPEKAKKLIDEKWGEGYYDKVIVQGSVAVALDDETFVRLNNL